MYQNNTTRIDQSHRLDLIGQCLESLYMRYRAFIPKGEEWQKMIKYLSYDMHEVETHDIPEFFRLAYKNHDGVRPPSNKHMLMTWREFRKGIPAQKYECHICRGSGWLSAESDKGNMTAFKCVCLNSMRICKDVKTFNPEHPYPGYKLMKVYQDRFERKDI